MANKKMNDHTFYKNVTAIGTGIEYVVDEFAKTMNLQFITSGTFTAKLWVKLIDPNEWHLWPCLKYPKYDLIDSETVFITDKKSIHQVDLVGITALRVQLTSVTGAISIYGRSVS